MNTRENDIPEVRDAQRAGKEIPGITVLQCKSLLYVLMASRAYLNLVSDACGPSIDECTAIIEEKS